MRAISAPPNRPGDRDTYSLRPGLHGPLNGLPRGAAERDLPLYLVRNALRNQCCLKLGLTDFVDIHADAFARQVLELLPELLNALSAASDYHARPGRVNERANLARLSLKLNASNGGVTMLIDDVIPNLEVLLQIRSVLFRAIREPVRLPVTDVPEAEPKRVNLMTH